MSITSDLEILGRALGYILSDGSCAARSRFSPACPHCYGTGATDVGRKTHKYDGGCEQCGGTGRVNDFDGHRAWRRLRTAFDVESGAGI